MAGGAEREGVGRVGFTFRADLQPGVDLFDRDQLFDLAPEHEAAADLLTALAEGDLPWALPWPCVYEFLRVLTHPRVLHPPVPMDRAREAIRRVLESPSLVLLSETDRHPDIMADVLESSGVTGNLVHDAHIAALCLAHGVGEIVTRDRDFTRFEGLRVIDPFD